MKNLKKLFAALAAAALTLAFFAPSCVFADFTAYPMTKMFPEDAVATYTVDAETDGAEFSWYLKADGVEYDFRNLDLSSAQWINYVTGFGVSADGKTLFFEGVTKDLNGAEIYCVCEENGVKTTSPSARVSVTDSGTLMPPDIKAPAKAAVTCGEKATLTVEVKTEEGVTYNYQWYTSFSRDIRDIKVILEDGYDGPSIEIGSDTPGTVNYCCMVESVKDGRALMSYTNIIPVEFKEAPPKETEVPTEEPADETPDGPVDPVVSPITAAQLAMICLTLIVAILSIAVVVVVIILVAKKRK